ncbi:heptose-I-phosphate ethanolaminephosphotransferase [Zymomonas mobilis]|uniref:phosphoethanolamine transferase n=1 Tax=Zymomonas mobilis TaxID=542 RepID=UPI00026D802B|nr:phosphoethanolamine transferase [Zymomonas mobilis]AFN56920.1 sulfatase [Zymomonas mobilis subsp. mobilis ATCC 29191]TQK77642.1 heptose-I-phosphate ethanolaminephosphotransferase [Zymomonas mobilis]TQL15708.1 heptose-I-phosphate ethanolaminephosphotransferase [Zymomonas mobilis]
MINNFIINVKNFLKRDYFLCKILYCFFISILNFYLAEHSATHHQIRSSLEIFVLPFFFFSLGAIPSAILNSILISLILFDIVVTYKCGFVTNQTIQAIIGTNKHEIISMLQTNNVAVILLSISLIILSVIFSYKIGKFNFKTIVVTGIVLLIPVADIYYMVIMGKGNFKVKMALVKDVSSFVRKKIPGVIGDTEYAFVQFIYPHKDPLFLSPPLFHQKRDVSVIGQHKGNTHNIVFIMGESSLASRYGVYGYKTQDTTPYLNRMVVDNKLCVIPHSHSAAPMTTFSVPMTFSFFSPGKPDLLLAEKNLIELARDNNYKTFWIASQDGSSFYARTYGYISEFSNYVTRQDFNNQQNGVNWRDESLLPVIKEKFLDKNPDKFYVIHIMGSHENYADKRTEEDILALPNADEYDQSIHRTDRILHQIIDMADRELGNYVLVYTSDHGEVVGKGHGLQYGGYDQYNIPMIIGDPTDKYCHYAEKIRNVDGYYSSLMNKYLLLDMLGYDIDPKVIEADRHTDPVLHSDDKVYQYRDIPTSK